MSEEVEVPPPSKEILPAKSEDKLEIEKEEKEKEEMEKNDNKDNDDANKTDDKEEAKEEDNKEDAEKDKENAEETKEDEKKQKFKIKTPKVPGFLRSKSKDRAANKNKVIILNHNCFSQQN